MSILRFDNTYFSELVSQAQNSSRRRQHRNVHLSFNDPCQRLFNALEPTSYIPPHRHASDPRSELLIAIRGKMALFTFSDSGEIKSCHQLATEKHGNHACQAIEVASHTWHTVVSMQPGSVVLEVKAGPFDPKQPKNLASWAPQEGDPMAATYLANLIAAAQNWQN